MRRTSRRLRRNSDLVEKVRDELLKLTIGTGGKSSHRKLTPKWEIGLYESSDDSYFAGLKLTGPPKSGRRYGQTVTLRRDQLYTRSKGGWRRSCVWRLTPETVATFAEQIAKILQDPRAQ